MYSFKKNKYLIIFIIIFILYYVNQKENTLNNKEKINTYIYELRVNHLKEPFGIDIKGNSFSFLANEDGPFRVYLLNENKIIQTKKVKLEECQSFYFKKTF